MARRKISQREAHRTARDVRVLRKEVSARRANLVDQLGTHLKTVDVSNADAWVVHAAQRCGQIIVARDVPGENKIKLYAVKP